MDVCATQLPYDCVSSDKTGAHMCIDEGVLHKKEYIIITNRVAKFLLRSIRNA